MNLGHLTEALNKEETRILEESNIQKKMHQNGNLFQILEKAFQNKNKRNYY